MQLQLPFADPVSSVVASSTHGKGGGKWHKKTKAPAAEDVVFDSMYQVTAERVMSSTTVPSTSFAHMDAPHGLGKSSRISEDGLLLSKLKQRTKSPTEAKSAQLHEDSKMRNARATAARVPMLPDAMDILSAPD